MRSSIEVLRRVRVLGVAVTSVLLAACGGGGGPSASAPPPNTSNLVRIEAGAAPAAPAGCRPVGDSGRVAQWSFDNVTGAKAFNTRFGQLHATLNSVSVRPGAIGQALYFDPALSQSYAHVDIVDRNGLYTPVTFNDASISIAMWIRPEQLQTGATYVLFDGQTFSLTLVDGVLRFAVGAEIVRSSASAVAGSWQHVAVTYDGQTARVYLNGVQDTTRSIVHGIPTAFNTLYIGGHPNGYETFPGAIDEVLLSNNALSASDVSGLANLLGASGTTLACGSAAAAPLTRLASGQEAHWSFDMVTAAQAPNIRFNGLHANLTSVNLVPGMSGQGLRFDPALQSHASIPLANPATWPVFPDARLSVAMWILPTQVQAGANYLLFGGDGGGGQSFHLRIVDGKVVLLLGSTDTSAATVDDVILRSTAAVVAGQWQHVVATSDGLSVRIYLNGVLDAEKVISHPVPTVVNTLYIGGLPGSGTSTFPGTIDELKLTNTTLSAPEIAALAN